MRDFSSADSPQTFTTQIFFDEALNDAVLATKPYNQRPARDTTNDQDTIFHPELIAATWGAPEDGLEAEFRIHLRRQGRE